MRISLKAEFTASLIMLKNQPENYKSVSYIDYCIAYIMKDTKGTVEGIETQCCGNVRLASYYCNPPLNSFFSKVAWNEKKIWWHDMHAMLG